MIRPLTMAVILDSSRTSTTRRASPSLRDLGGSGVHVFLPCPLDPVGLPDRTVPPARPIMALPGERYRNGYGRTICACGDGEALFSGPADEVPMLQDAIRRM